MAVSSPITSYKPLLDEPSVKSKNEGICAKITNIWHWCRGTSALQQNYNLGQGDQALDSPLLSSSVTKKKIVTPRCINSSFVHRSAGAISLVGMVTSTALLSSLLRKIAVSCFDAEVESQNAFNECNEPYVSSLALYNSILAVSSFISGYLMQRLLKKPSSETSHQLQRHQAHSLDVAESSKNSIPDRIKSLLTTLQDKYAYEIGLGWIYLYNGFFINVSNISTFNDFLNCSSAGIGIGSCLLGMYARDQWIHLHNNSEQPIPISKTFRLHDHWKSIVVSTMAASALTITFVTDLETSSKANEAVREIAFMLLARPIGNALATWIDLRKANLNASKITRLTADALDFRISLISIGYLLYFLPVSTSSHCIGISLIGFTHGVKDSRYQNSNDEEPLLQQQLPLEDRCSSLTSKVKHYVRNYWRTTLLAGFGVTLEKFQFLNCKGPPTPYNYTCPIGLEISGYFSGNLIVVESDGFNIALITALTHYYTRKLLKKAKQSNVIFFRKAAKIYIDYTNKYQFDALTIIPYAIFKSGSYLQAYENGFYTYNPIAPLVFLGVTIGTYKEQVNSRQ